jgi:hypothetical protein
MQAFAARMTEILNSAIVGAARSRTSLSNQQRAAASRTYGIDL